MPSGVDGFCLEKHGWSESTRCSACLPGGRLGGEVCVFVEPAAGRVKLVREWTWAVCERGLLSGSVRL
jgi:hypothetical protein